jgi:hypothetical protein
MQDNPNEIWSAITGVVLAQVVGANELDGAAVYGIVIDPDKPPTFLTQEAAFRLVHLLEEAFEMNDTLD